MKQIKTALALPLILTLGLAGCADMGSREGAGIATGAAVGGILGAALPGPSRPAQAVAGAVIGGVAGGMIGTSLDRQAGELRAGFGDDRITVVNTGSSLVVTMPQDILFATDSAQLSSALTSDLGVLAGHLGKYPNSVVQVLGHTDNVGEAAYNLSLSKQRAEAVRSVLVANGVSSSRVMSIGKGEDQPVASNLTPEGRQQNRRVEIVIIPN